ncbi:MAG: PAC2 family protein [Methanobacteriota archaeon]
MNSISVHDYMTKDLTNSMVVVSFPTIGLVSTIAANFMVTNLKLELVGSFASDDFYPAAIVQDGVPMPPVRIYAGDHVCGPKGACNQLVVITSELPIKAGLIAPLADKIIDWCMERKCHIVVAVEGVNSTDLPKDPVKIFHVGSTPGSNGHLKDLGTEPLLTGMVSGLSGLLLYKGNFADFDVVCLLVEAHAEYPDSRSAAQVLTVLNKMIPQIEIDPKPLLGQAIAIEAQVRKAIAQIKPLAQPEMPDAPPGMYR